MVHGSTYQTRSIQIQLSRSIHDINFIFAPSCTSQEFTLEVKFYYIHSDKNAKFFEILNIFGKFDPNFQIIMAKYKIHVNNTFFQKAQKTFKKQQ